MFQLGCANRVCFQNEILAGLTVALALVPEAVARRFHFITSGAPPFTETGERRRGKSNG